MPNAAKIHTQSLHRGVSGNESTLIQAQSIEAPETIPPAATKTSYGSLPHKRQLAVLMLARLAEPLATSSIQSYVFFQLQSFDRSATAATISAQAGLIYSGRTVMHVCTGLLWGRLADSEYGGRKLTLVIGLVTSAIAMLGYGFSKSFTAAVTWSMVDGALNATVSMVRCMTSELNPQKQHRVRALTLLPLCANMGHLLGPLIGGFLASSKPEAPSNALVPDYPYAAPNIFVAAFHLVVALVVMLSLDETLESSRSWDRKVFKWLWGPSRHREHLRTSNQQTPSESLVSEERESLLGNVQDTQCSYAVRNSPGSRKNVTGDRVPKTLPFRKIWTFNVFTTMLAHFVIAGHLGTFSSLWAVFLSAPQERSKPRSPPFHFSGGLGMEPSSVGVAMSLLGAIGMIMQIAIYPTLNDRMGTVALWRFALLIFPFTYFLAPYCSLVGSHLTLDDTAKPSSGSGASRQVPVWIAVLFVLLLFLAGRTGVAPATSLLINDCTPHPTARGTVHTMGTVVSNLSRSVFPAAALAIFGVGLRIGVVGLGFWFLAGLAALACVTSLWVKEGSNGRELLMEEEEESAA